MESIGKILRKHRINAGLSVKEISNILIKNGFKASEKTIYSWESDNSQPNPDAFLFLCEKYNISDILKEFGYEYINETSTPDEDSLLTTYRKLSLSGKSDVRNFADYTLTKEQQSAASEKHMHDDAPYKSRNSVVVETPYASLYEDSRAYSAKPAPKKNIDTVAAHNDAPLTDEELAPMRQDIDEL